MREDLGDGEMMVDGLLLKIVALMVLVGSGYERGDAPRLIGSYAVSASGEFLFCGAKRGLRDRRYAIVPLKKGARKPLALSFPGADRCFGARWRPESRPEELLFIAGGEPKTIRLLRVSDGGVRELSSHAVDPNFLVGLPLNCWSPKGTVFALSVWPHDRAAATSPCLAFSKDNGKALSLSEISPPGELLWVDDATFYMCRTIDADETTGYEIEVAGMTTTVYGVYIMALSKAELNVDDMAVTVHPVLQGNNICLLSGNPQGSLVYMEGERLLRDGRVLAVMPEEINRPYVDGDHMAAVSADGRKLFVLDAAGRITSRIETREESDCIGISSATQRAYLVASSLEDRVKVYAYDFAGKSVEVVFEADSLF